MLCAATCVWLRYCVTTTTTTIHQYEMFDGVICVLCGLKVLTKKKIFFCLSWDVCVLRICVAMLVWNVLWCVTNNCGWWSYVLKTKKLVVQTVFFSKLCLQGSGADWCVWHSLCSEFCAASAAGWGFALSPLRSGVTTAKLESNKGHLSLPWKYILFLFV